MVFLIGGAQIGAVRGALSMLPVVLPLYARFLILAVTPCKLGSYGCGDRGAGHGRALRHDVLFVVGAAQVLQIRRYGEGPSVKQKRRTTVWASDHAFQLSQLSGPPYLAVLNLC